MSKKKKSKDRMEEIPEKKQGKMSKSEYEKEIYRLQEELVQLQDWIKFKGLRVIVIFEGRDAAGKGGMIRRITERVSPRIFRVVALPAPSDREKNQLYIQRYLAHFPAAGEMVIFDRSWYNRLGVENVMGFCSPKEYKTFLAECPRFEAYIVNNGIMLIKYFFNVGMEQQEKRFLNRIKDPARHWKLSPMDLESYRLWWEYTEAYDTMLTATNTEFAPWYVVDADNKQKARLNCIAHLLSMIPYEKTPYKKQELPERKKRGKGLIENINVGNKVPEKY